MRTALCHQSQRLALFSKGCFNFSVHSPLRVRLQSRKTTTEWHLSHSRDALRPSPSSFLALHLLEQLSLPLHLMHSLLWDCKDHEPKDVISSERSSATAVSSCLDSFCYLWVTAYKVAHSDNLHIFGNMVFEWHVVCYHRQTWTLICFNGYLASHWSLVCPVLNPTMKTWTWRTSRGESPVTVLYSRTGVTSRILSGKVKTICAMLRKVFRAVSEVKLKWTCNFLHAQRV